MSVENCMPKLDWESKDMPATLQLFKQKCSLYFSVKGVKEDKQVDHILLFAGDQGIRIFNSWGLSETEGKDPTVVWGKFGTHFEPTTNFRISRFYLQKMSQGENESFDDFVARCRLQALKCDFKEQEKTERIIEQIIVGTRHTEVQKVLLQKDKTLSLQQALDIGRAHEASISYMKSLVETTSNNSTVDYIRTDGKRVTQTQQHKCHKCGREHPKAKCPAYGTKCTNCGKMNHWGACCKSKKQQKRSEDSGSNAPGNKFRGKGKCQKNVHEIEEHIEDGFHCYHIDNINGNNDELSEIHVPIQIKMNQKSVAIINAKIDTGSQANTIPVRIYRKMFPQNIREDGLPKSDLLSNNKTKLTAYNKTTIKQYGAIKLQTRYQDNWYDALFYIVETDGPCIVGLQTSLNLKLITFNNKISGQNMRPPSNPINLHELKENTKGKEDGGIKELVKKYPNQFDKIGRFPGEYHIVIDPKVQPSVHAPRKFPIQMREKLKEELDEMEKQGVIAKVTEPTDWVNSLVTAPKKDGGIRICLDPKDLNKAIKRSFHKTPTIEELTHKLHGATVFSKLDAKNGYWSVVLDQESSLLTTFNTPFGRYAYLRMPMGLKMSQDVFQQKMDFILETCPGTISIADDIVCFGKTQQEHDKNLHTLMQVAKENGLVFNSKKCEIRKPSVKFFGAIYDKRGIRADDEKIKTISALPDPNSKKELQHILGILNYMSPFTPNLSTAVNSLRRLLGKDAEFVWTDSHTKTLEDAKRIVCQQITLAYFNPEAESIIQVDASSTGIGAVLTQNGRPIMFASKSLSDTEQRYANIEREMLAVVFGCERFHTFLFGKGFIVESDHKPLEMIKLKHLTAAPPRLLRMLLRLQPYDMTIRYKPGKEMVVADSLSRLPAEDAGHIDFDLKIDLVYFSKQKVDQLRHNTERDHVLRHLAKIIVKGWPSSMKELPSQIKPYWAFRDELAVEDGIIMKGDRIVLPADLKEEVIEKLHRGHQGIEKTRLRARDCVYWPGMNEDIQRVIEKCETCQEFRRTQGKEPLQSHEIPVRPWQWVHSDLFSIGEDNYLLITDAYSKFPFIRELRHNTSSLAVINQMKELFAEQGIPERIYSDNGPQYSAEQFKRFTTTWDIEHITSSPHLPRSNGFIERCVQTVKRTIKKAISSHTDVQLALLSIRATPIDHVVPSPGQLLYGRKLRTDVHTKIRNGKDNKQAIYEQYEKHQEQNAKYYNQNKKELEPLEIGQAVRLQNPTTRKWTDTGVVSQQLQEPRSYAVQTEKGNLVRRNRQQILRSSNEQAETTRNEKTDQSEEEKKEPQPANQSDNAGNKTTTRSGRQVKPPTRYDE